MSKKTGLTAQQHLADYLCKMQNLLTMDCMKYWRSAGENRLTEAEAVMILETLNEISRHVAYAKNCCWHAINNREESETQQP